jgi:hypothetical protein
MRLAAIATVVFLLNLPFGYWRSRTRKFSWQWFVSIHLPVAIIITYQVASGMGFQLAALAVRIAAFFLGQLAGGRIGRMLRGRSPSGPSPRERSSRPGEGGSPRISGEPGEGTSGSAE